MKIKTVFYYGLFCSFLIYFSFSFDSFSNDYKPLDNKSNFKTKQFSSMVLFDLIEKYSDEYSIPKHIAYNVAFKETTYMGPFHWNYNPNQVSSVGAVGPMQVLPKTCNWINNSNYSKNKIMSDLELNVMTSMKLLNYLYKKYGNWSIVCGWYNTGRPVVNDYGRYCATNLDYESKWISFQ